MLAWTGIALLSDSNHVMDSARCAGSARPSSGAKVPFPLRLRKTSSLRDQYGTVSWNPTLDPPRPPASDALDTADEALAPGDSMPSFTYSERRQKANPMAADIAVVDASFLPPELQNTPAIQQPHASSVRMSVNNCHMLQYRATKSGDESAPGSRTDMELVSIPAAVAPSAGGRQKAGMLKKQPTYLSVKIPTNRVQPALVTVTQGALMPCACHCLLACLLACYNLACLQMLGIAEVLTAKTAEHICNWS